MSKLAKFRKRHGEPKRNPPLGTDLAEYIVPGFAAFAATRALTRFATAQISKRYPKYAKHAGAIASVGTVVAAWFGAHKVKYLEKYHHPIVIGSSLATLQSLIQLYAPKLGWILGDPMPASQAPAKMLAAPSTPLLAASQAPPVPQGFKETSASEWFTYNDAYDAGSYRGKQQASPPPVPTPTDSGTQVSDLLDNSDLQLDNADLGLDGSMGSFS